MKFSKCWTFYLTTMMRPNPSRSYSSFQGKHWGMASGIRSRSVFDMQVDEASDSLCNLHVSTVWTKCLWIRGFRLYKQRSGAESAQIWGGGNGLFLNSINSSDSIWPTNMCTQCELDKVCFSLSPRHTHASAPAERPPDKPRLLYQSSDIYR